MVLMVLPSLQSEKGGPGGEVRPVAPTLEPMWHKAILYSTLHCKSVESGDLKF